jgi:Zn-dependent protease
VSNFLWYPIEDLPFIFIVIMIAFTVHEFAHAYSAYKFGDRTAYDAGRVTLNPRVHIDIFGMILLLIAGFGWARPVPVNRSKFKNPRLMGIVVSAVGPLSNLVTAALGILLLYVLNQTGLMDVGSIGVHRAIIHFLYYLITINLMLFIFNLIPIPPLDGYRIIQDLVPLKVRFKMDQNVHWGMFVFLLIIFIPQLRAVTLDPLFSQSSSIIEGLQNFYELFFRPVSWQSFILDFLGYTRT